MCLRLPEGPQLQTEYWGRSWSTDILLALVSSPSAGKEVEMRKIGRVRLICRRHCVTRRMFPELIQRWRLSGAEHGRERR